MALLYMRLSKFNNLEKKQEKLMAEMDDAIGAYLSELKEENERLIQIIDKRYDNADVRSTVATTIQSAENERQLEKKPHSIRTPNYPMNVALKSYQSAPYLSTGSVSDSDSKVTELDDRTRAFNMYDEGKPVEEIAKKLGKGKTEVELLLKFR